MPKAPTLKNDCFALPAGVHWTPVDQALAHLRAALEPIVGVETLSPVDAGDRVLARDAIAIRANPAYANSAIDGYGFAFASMAATMPLLEGRSAAGQPFEQVVRAGHAIRILTGAKLPAGVDTVIMQEDVTLANGQIHFQQGLKAGANCRVLGEDMQAGAVAVQAGVKVGAAEIALLAALNISQIQVFKKLRVGVLSTGDEIKQLGQAAEPHQIYDANRPMLLEILRKWGLQPVDLGHAKDSKSAVIAALDTATKTCDAILTSGGASAGEEDHLSTVLAENGKLDLWRIAIKPGRPLALGMWKTIPVFGLPGNPVAAFVTTLIFARPALLKMQGQGWQLPEPQLRPAKFEISKKAGRREYLRARITNDGHVEKFISEGSGRISSLVWADGLIELPDQALILKHGDNVRYYPYSAFGLT